MLGRVLRRPQPGGPQPLIVRAALIGQAFLGGESLLLLGFERSEWPVRSALRRFAVLIREHEEEGSRAVGPTAVRE